MTPALSIGLRAKTARAIAVAVRAGPHGPVALRRAELTFATPATPATFQPFHEVMDRPWSEACRAVEVAERDLVDEAARVLRRFLEETNEGLTASVGIVGPPNRALERIASPHIRAHAAEGVLFRRILEGASSECGLDWLAFDERELDSRAGRELGLDEDAIKDVLARFGREVGRPWRADEKAAAMGAWLALSSRSSTP